jgi:hypothetical protein
MTVLAKIVDVPALWQTIWTAAVAGIGVSIVFSLAVLGSTRSLDARRQGGSGAFYAAIALLGVAGTAAVIVFAVILITAKS